MQALFLSGVKFLLQEAYSTSKKLSQRKQLISKQKKNNSVSVWKIHNRFIFSNSVL